MATTGIPLDDDSLKQKLIPVPLRDATGVAPPGPLPGAKAIPDAPPIPTMAPGQAPQVAGTPNMPILAPKGHAIPMGRVPGIEGTIDPQTQQYNTPPPNQPGVAALWAKAENIHNPALRVLGEIGAGGARVLDTLGSTFLPGLSKNIPGTTAHENMEVAQKNAEENREIGNAEKKAATAHTEAETGAIPSHTALEEAEAKKDAREPVEKPENVQQIYADAVQDAVTRGVDPNADPKVKQLADTITSLQKQGNPQEKLDQQYQDALASGDHEKAERILQVKSDLAKAGQAPQRPPQTMVVLPNGQTEVARPGTVLPEGTQNIGGFSTLGRPTTQERNVGAQAKIAAEGIPPVIAEIDRLKDQIGPVAGRWNEFMQGKVGMENTDMAGLRADLLMVSSAVALAHARGRLPENLREEFDRAINAPKQSAENLKATLNHIQPWMARMENIGQQGQTAEAAPTEYKPGLVRNGYKFKGGDPTDKASWEKQ